MSESSARVLLVRHAQHKTSVGESGLTVLGERQAKALAAAIQRGPTDALVSSPMKRAMATAAAFGMTFDVVEGLQEFDFGPEAPDAATMVAERTDLTIWRADHGFAGGETLSEFQARISTTVEALVSGYPGGTIVAVTHAGVIDAALRWAYALAPDAAWVTEAVLPNASVTEVEHWPSGRRSGGAPRFTLVHRVGDASHLEPELVTEI